MNKQMSLSGLMDELSQARTKKEAAKLNIVFALANLILAARPFLAA